MGRTPMAKTRRRTESREVGRELPGHPRAKDARA